MNYFVSIFLSLYNTKSFNKKKDRFKATRVGLLNKSSKYHGVKGVQQQLSSSNPRDIVNGRIQNKTTMNYSKNRKGLKNIAKNVPISLPKHRKNVTSGGSYSTIQAKGITRKKYIAGKGSKLGYLDEANSRTKFEISYTKQGKRIKQKSSHTFGDLAKINLILNKNTNTIGKIPSTHTKKLSMIKKQVPKGKPIKLFKTYDGTTPKKALVSKKIAPTSESKNPRLLTKYLSYSDKNS